MSKLEQTVYIENIGSLRDNSKEMCLKNKPCKAC